MQCSAEKIIEKFVTYLYHGEYCIRVVELGLNLMAERHRPFAQMPKI